MNCIDVLCYAVFGVVMFVAGALFVGGGVV